MTVFDFQTETAIILATASFRHLTDRLGGVQNPLRKGFVIFGIIVSSAFFSFSSRLKPGKHKTFKADIRWINTHNKDP